MPTLTEAELHKLQEADASWNVATLSVAFAGMMVSNSALTFACFERQLRELNSNTYLVARNDLENLPSRVMCREFLAFNRPAESWLWICLHGKEERDELLQLLKTTEDENLEMLETCGVLFNG